MQCRGASWRVSGDGTAPAPGQSLFCAKVRLAGAARDWWDAAGFSPAKDERGEREPRRVIHQRSVWKPRGSDPPRSQQPHGGAGLGRKTNAEGLALANAYQNPPSPQGVAIRGGGCRIPPQKSRIEGPMYYTQTIRIPRMGISPSPPWGIQHPPRGDPRRTVHVPATKGAF
jgi:hypothetical protein